MQIIIKNWNIKNDLYAYIFWGLHYGPWDSVQNKLLRYIYIYEKKGIKMTVLLKLLGLLKQLVLTKLGNLLRFREYFHVKTKPRNKRQWILWQTNDMSLKATVFSLVLFSHHLWSCWNWLCPCCRICVLYLNIQVKWFIH